MERARGDEQYVIGLDRAVLGRDRRALDQRQEIALHALAADVAHHALAAAAADLVELVDENDAVLLDGGDRLPRDLLLVEQLVAFLALENGRRLGHGHAPGLGARAHLAEDVAEICLLYTSPSPRDRQKS